MRTTRCLPAALAAAMLLAGCGADPEPGADAGAEAGTRQFGAINFVPCSLTSASGGQSIDAQCAALEVPEDRARPEGRRISLNIAWLPATSQGAGTPDPVFGLAGGPGQAATEHAATFSQALREVRKQRDLILIDQRGTGGSNPLDCRDATGQPMPIEGIADTSIEALVDYARECAATVAERADPRHYTTTAAVADLDAVREALGVEQINLVGASYGTRVAQQYASTHPDHTRSLVLDGVAPNELVVGGEFATTFEDALALQSAQCRKLPACSQRFDTDLREQLAQVIQTLKTAPVEVDYRDPTTGEPLRDTVTADTLTTLAFMFSYAPQTSALLPLVIDEAAQGRYAPLMSLTRLITRGVGDQMNRGMQWSVLCAEDADRHVADPRAAETLLGAELSDMLFAACKVWPAGERPAGFNAPFKSDVPTLLLSGELDPVTPPRYGERVAAGATNGRHFVLKGQGHGAMLQGCMPKLLGQFIEGIDPAALDAKCLDSLTYVPPFTSFSGWEP